MKPAVLEARALHLHGRLHDVALRVETGQCVVLTGPNGSGKSSLLRVLLGLEPPSSGEILLADRPLSRLSRREIARHLAWLPQRPELSEGRTTEELVASARFRFGESEALARKAARHWLETLDADFLIGRRTDQISGGELQRVLLATLLAQEAPLLFIDEPANHLDPLQQWLAYRALGEAHQRGHGILLVTHDLRLARFLAPAHQVEVIGMREGRFDFRAALDSPELPDLLGRIHGVPFRAGPEPGDLWLSAEELS